MFEELNQHRAAVAEQIQKACEIGFTGNELEKAHKVGDIHPNGKWVWTQLPSGKYDWRVIKKTGAPSGSSAPAAAQKTAQSEKMKEFVNILKKSPYNSDSEHHLEQMDVDELKRFIDFAHKCWLDDENLNRSTRLQCKEWRDLAKKELASKDEEARATQQENEYRKKHPNSTTKNSDIQQQTSAGKVSDEALSFGLNFVKTILSNKEKELEKIRKERPGAKVTIAKIENEVRYFKGQEKAISEKIKAREESSKLPKITLTEKDFKKGLRERDEYTGKNAIDLHNYTGESIEYYTDKGEKKKSRPYISEFYSSARQDAVGGYEAYFDRADSIGTFRTLKEAVSALEAWINKVRVKGHAKPDWIYNASKGTHQMKYRLD